MNSFKINKYQLFSYVSIVLVSFLLLHLIAIPSLNGDIKLKFYFDTLTYYERAKLFSNEQPFSFLGLYEMAINNTFGPVVLGFVTNNNPYLIWVINLVIYFICANYLIKILDLKIPYFHLLVYLNLITWISIVTLNKEIFIFASLASLIYYLNNKNLLSLTLVILSGFLVRWQMVLFSLVVIVLLSRVYMPKDNRKFNLISLLLGLSILLPIYLSDYISSIQYWRNYSISIHGEGTGLYEYWTMMDANFLYIISFPFKLLHLTVLNAIDFLIFPKINLDYFHNFSEILQSFAFIYLYFIIFIKKGLRKLNNDILYITIIYFIIFVVVQYFTPRYLFGGYILLCILISREKYLSKI